jgi:hypothetical protein
MVGWKRRWLGLLVAFALVACGRSTPIAQTPTASPSPTASAQTPLPGGPLSLELITDLIVDLVERIIDLAPIALERKPEVFDNHRLAVATTALPNSALLAVYDFDHGEVELYPEAGVGIKGPGEIVTYRRFIFTRDFKAWVYDLDHDETILLFHPRQVGGYVILTFPDALGNLYVLGTDNLADALLGIGKNLYVFHTVRPSVVPLFVHKLASVSAEIERLTGRDLPDIPEIPEELFFPWDPVPKAFALQKINTEAALHGGITSFFITLNAQWIVWTSGDGHLYLYDNVNPHNDLLPFYLFDKQGGAQFVTIDLILGRFIAWQDATCRRILLYDRLSRRLDTLPYAQFLDDLSAPRVLAVVPFFYGVDPFHLYIEVLRIDGTVRYYSYDILTEQVYALAVLNAFLFQLDQRRLGAIGVPDVLLSSPVLGGKN